MNFLDKKESNISNITFIAIMSAINVVFTLLSFFIPIAGIILVLFMPLISVLTTLLCHKKYVLIYFVATVFLCLIITLKDFSDTFFYVIPSLVTGITFGVLIQKKVSVLHSILIISLINMGLMYFASLLIKLIYQERQSF